MDFMLGEKKRIFMLNEFEAGSVKKDVGIEAQAQQLEPILSILRPTVETIDKASKQEGRSTELSKLLNGKTI